MTREAPDETVTFRALSLSSEMTREAPDETMQFAMVGMAGDATISFRMVSPPVHGLPYLNGDRGEAEFRTLIYSILAGLKPREREVIELSFRHDLHDQDLAIALGVSASRAQVLAARVGSRLEEALNALHIALTRRETCPVLGELLTDWDGHLTEDTRDVVSGTSGSARPAPIAAGARCVRRCFPVCCRWLRSPQTFERRSWAAVPPRLRTRWPIVGG